MDPVSRPPLLSPAGSLSGNAEDTARIVAAVFLPLMVGAGAALANIAFIGLLALPILLGGWVGCMWLALSVRHKAPCLLKQLGISLLITIGLFLLLLICATVARLAGAGSTRHGTLEPVDLIVWNVAAVGPALLVSWGQKLRAELGPAAWRVRLLYWFAYCPVSAGAGALLARCGLAPGN